MSTTKTIILTGASRGIGLATAHYLLKQKHNVVAVARSKEPLEKLSSEYPGQVKVLAGDLADFSLSQKAIELAQSTWKGLDGLLLIHGILEPVGKISEASAEEWRHLFDVNIFSGIAIIKACLPALRESKGRIVLCSSGAASHAYVGWGAYGASKAAMNHMALTMAAEEPDVTTVSIRPGVVDTNMQQNIRDVHHAGMTAEDSAKFKDLKASGKLLKPEQPGNVMARLGLDAPKELSGRFLSWDDKELAKFQD